ncbi:MAG: hypothetical protein ABI297_05185 [Ginsengibacter sp.]
MATIEDEDPEPPELKKQGMPPLKRELKFLIIGVTIAFIIVLIFSIAFWFHDKR